MSLKEQLSSDLKTSLKSGDKETVLLLRFVLAQIHNKEIEKREREPDAELANEEVIDVLQRELKKRKEAAELFRKGNREDLAKREDDEAVLIAKYLPKPLGWEEIGAVIEELIAAGFKDFNSLIKESMKKLKGQADGKVVTEIIKEKLKVR